MPAPLLLGIEIGGTKLQVGVGRGDGVIRALVREPIDPKRGSDAIKKQIVEAVASLRRQASGQAFAVAGVGFGGPVDTQNGTIIRSHQVEGWDGFAIADWLRAAIGVSLVIVNNDADSAAFAEARFGAGVGFSPLLYVNSGSGIGGGLVIDDRLYRGSGLGALEIGHLWLETPETGHGRTPRSLEDLASGWGIARAGREALKSTVGSGGILDELTGGDPNRVTCVLIAEAARAGDRVSLETLENAARAMAQGLAHAVTLLAPRRVVLGGGVSLLGESLWLAPIRNALDELVYPGFRGRFDVVPAALGEEVVVQGALALAREAWSMLSCG